MGSVNVLQREGSGKEKVVNFRDQAAKSNSHKIGNFMPNAVPPAKPNNLYNGGYGPYNFSGADLTKSVLNANMGDTITASTQTKITPKTMIVDAGASGSLRKRSGPGLSYSVISEIKTGASVNVVGRSGDWYKLSDGSWVHESGLTSGQPARSANVYQSAPTYAGGSSTTYNSANNVQAKNRQAVKAKTKEYKEIADTATSKALDAKFKNAMMKSNSVKRVADLKRTIHILGGPFQYMEHVDFRPNPENGLGRRFGETIMCEPPVVNFIPCVPTYLPELNKETKKHVSAALTNWLKGTDQYGKVGLEALFKPDAEVRYFTATPAYPRYIRIVNLLCKGLARFMDLQAIMGPDGVTPLGGYDWSTYKWIPKNMKTTVTEKKKSGNVFEAAKDFSQKLFKVLSYENINVPFYVDSSTSINESYSNSTTQSQFAGMANNLEGLIKDYQFFTGALGAGSLQNASNSMADAADSISGFARLNDGIFRRFLRGTSEILRGSNLIFPDIWSDSSPSRNVSVTMNFTSPYGDPLSIFLHVLVPLMYCLYLHQFNHLLTHMLHHS